MLGGVRRVIRRRRLLGASVKSLALAVCGIAVVGAGDHWLVLREGTAFAAVATVLSLALANLLWQWFNATFRPPRLCDLALHVERAHPELMDAFVCAVELEEKDGELGPLERALVERMTAELEQTPGMIEALRSSGRWGQLGALAALVVVLAGIQLRSDAVRKAAWRARDLGRGGGTSGLTIGIPKGPFPEHSDIRIEAQVHRWSQDASIVYLDGDGQQRYAMNRDASGQQFFTFYDVTGTIRFRVLTSALASRWYTLEVYSPPKFHEVRMEIDPPVYTGIEGRSFSNFRNCTVVEGAQMRLHVRTDTDVEAMLVPTGGGEPQPFIRSGDETRDLAFPVAEKMGFHVRLRTPQGWTTDGPRVSVSVEPDLPPVVDVLAPRRDVQVKAGERVRLEAKAVDDFGLRKVLLTYTVSGGKPVTLVLFEQAGIKPDGTRPEPVLDTHASHDFDLIQLKAEPGDVISYALVVVDNREPEAQSARSDVYFITVRPELDPPKDGKGKGKGENKKLDIGPLIAELKRLIRFTWDTLGIPASERGEIVAKLLREMKDLRLEVRKTYNKAMEMMGGGAPPPVPQPAGPATVEKSVEPDRATTDIPTLFLAAEGEVKRAANMIDKALVEESLTPQQRGLALLIRLENELLKNAKKQQGEGKGKEKGKPKNKEQDKKQEENARQQRQRKLDALKKALDRVRELGARQERINEAIARNQDSAAPDVAAGLAQKQRELQKDTKRLEEDLAKIAEAARAARDLQGAGREMKRGANRLDDNAMKPGLRHGERAQNLLRGAVQSLEEALRKEAANQIAALAGAARQLADMQSEEAGKSQGFKQDGNPSEQDVDAARKRQSALKEAARELRSAVERTAAEMQENYPDAAQAMTKAADGMRKGGVEKKMGRATNALLYKRFGKAQREQTDAANLLEKMAEDLQQAAGKLPAMSREELLEAMQRLQKQAQQVQKAARKPGEEGQGELERAREQAASELERLNSALQDADLQQLVENMSLPLSGENNAAAGRQLLGMFRSAMRVLEKHLILTEMNRKLNLSRQTSEPPEKYRRMVQQYFKDLSQEK